MTKSRNTKRALLMSVLSMMLCIAMLAGSTFAWFTDSVTSGKNRIVAGNLDVELEYKTGNMTDYKNVNATDVPENPFFRSKDGDPIKWEPGVMAYTYFKVTNEGSLALKYALTFVTNAVNTLTTDDVEHDLSEVIRFAVIDGEADLSDGRSAVALANLTYEDSDSFTRPGSLLSEEEAKKVENGKSSDVFTVVAYWEPNVKDDNLFNVNNGAHVSDYEEEKKNNYLRLDIEVNLIATQTPHEYDSFGNDYDKDLKLPVIVSSPVISGKPVIIQAKTDNNTDYSVKFTADADAFPDTVKDATLTVGDGVLPAAIKITVAQESKVFEISLKDQDGNKITATDGKLFTVEISVDSGLNGVSVYHKDTLMVDDGENLTNVADHYVYDKENGIVTMKVNSFSPFTVLYNSGKYEEVAFGLYKIADQNNAYAVANADGFVALNEAMAGQEYDVASITLLNDIDMTGKTWTPVDLHADRKVRSLCLIDGKGHTISHLNINGQAMFTRFAGSADLITIKDLSFDSATVSFSAQITAIIAGQCYQNVLFDNVDIKNSAITGTYKVSPYIAQVHDEKPTHGVTVTLKDCDVSKTVVTGTSYDFCIAGMVAFVYESEGEKVAFENCTVKDVTLKAPSKVYNACAAVYCNDGSAEGSFNETEGVTVTNANVEYTAQ